MSMARAEWFVLSLRLATAPRLMSPLDLPAEELRKSENRESRSSPRVDFELRHAVSQAYCLKVGLSRREERDAWSPNAIMHAEAAMQLQLQRQQHSSSSSHSAVSFRRHE